MNKGIRLKEEVLRYLQTHDGKFSVRQVAKNINRMDSYSYILKICNKLYEDGLINMEKVDKNYEGRIITTKLVEHK